MKGRRRWTWQLAEPTQDAKPFRDERNLTCPHGRFWRSCQRCRLPRETGERNVGISGESRQRLASEASQ